MIVPKVLLMFLPSAPGESAIGESKVHVIQHVEAFTAKLQPNSFSESEVLDQ